MTVNYTLTVQDLVVATMHMTTTFPHRRGRLGHIVHVATWVLFFPLLGVILFAVSDGVARFVGFGPLLCLSLLNHRSIRASILEECLDRQYSAPGNEIFYGHRILTTSPDGIQVRGDGSDSRYPWSALYCVHRTKSHLLLYLGPSLVHCIPLADLPEETSSELLANLREHLPQERFGPGA